MHTKRNKKKIIHLFFSDATVELRDRIIPVHKFVLAARSDHWISLSENAVLGAVLHLIV